MTKVYVAYYTGDVLGIFTTREKAINKIEEIIKEYGDPNDDDAFNECWYDEVEVE